MFFKMRQTMKPHTKCGTFSNLENFNTKETPTESKKGGALLYMSLDINCKVPKDLKPYIEIIYKNKKDCIIRSI